VCGRYTLAGKPVNLERHFRAKLDKPATYTESYNISPGTSNIVITSEITDSFVKAIWGIHPYWSEDVRQSKPLINTRVESLRDKHAFKIYLNTKRCIIPAAGYFEWKKMNNKYVEPYYISPIQDDFWGFAGIFETEVLNGEKSLSFSIITQNAGDSIASIHDRMPLILPSNSYGDWLEGNHIDELIKFRITASELRFFRVSHLVNSPRNNSPAIIQQIPETGHLF